MENVDSKWVMYGVEWDDPECIHTVDEAIEYIDKIGFLPLFRNDIPGFSLEERTYADFWWSGNPEIDPWEWRAAIARSGRVVYGKFFDGKAGFISKEWLPYFVNYRRDGYDFDSLWDDQKASIRLKKVMDLFAEENADAEYYSAEVKAKAGFGKEGEKGFEGTITNLQMMLYLCVRDFRQKINKKGEGYGWPVAVYTTPEHIFGYDMVTSAYSEDPVESGKRIAMHIFEDYPIATPQQIKKLLGIKVGDTPERIRSEKKKEKKTNYPLNLFKELGLDIKEPTKDQVFGLEYMIGQFKENIQEILRMRYERGLTYKEIGEKTGKTPSSCSSVCKKAIKSLKGPKKLIWITEGLQGHLDKIK